AMSLDERDLKLCKDADKAREEWTITIHSFADLSHTPPIIFLYLLKECYLCGTWKAVKKFRSLQQQVHQALKNSPQPGPATFIAHCLYILPLYEAYAEGFSHLIVSSLRRHLKTGTTSADLQTAKALAAQLFIAIVNGRVVYDEKIAVKIVEAFDIQLTDIEKVICNSELIDSGHCDTARTFLERFISQLLESQSYSTVVSLLQHFSLRESSEPFLFRLIEEKEFKAADKWATFMGKPMLCLLVKEYVELNLMTNAYEILKKNNLRQEFPDVYHKCKESSLKKLAEKGCWDVAEAKTNNDRQLIEYLVYLAMEAGYAEKVDELCDKYSLEGFVKTIAPEACLLESQYLHLNELLSEDITWVDEVNGLLDATSYIEACKVVGLDCEWKPNFVKGSKPNKVSIMQLASEKKVFIFDLIKLYDDVPDTLDSCLVRILHSPRILKLGYNFQCDIKHLASSYGNLKCFRHYEMLLDIQNVFKEPRGGLSGLAKKILGVGLNKTRRNSNWEQRPLGPNQLEYAALDAVVLIHIFSHIRDHSHPITNRSAKRGWKSYIIPRMDNAKSNKNLGEKTKTETSFENPETDLD
uniref:3'-5' exonuclease domain-containing protein n=1 Tax=Kalanchoe fedtschenkoi TaxID=63787 RepID=A0A7N0U816_KALFE